MLSENVRRLREDNDLTLEELGHKLGVTRQHISYIEQGLKDPSLKLLQRISKVFDVTIDELMR